MSEKIYRLTPNFDGFMPRSLFSSLYINLFLFWLMLFSLIHFQLPFFSGYIYSPPTFTWYILQLCLLFILSHLLPNQITNPIQIVQVLLAIFLTIPTFILAFTNSISLIQAQTKWYAIFSVLIVQYIFLRASRLFPDTHRFEYRKSFPGNYILYALLLMTVTLSTFVIVYGGLNFTLTDFNDLYSMREKFVQNMRSLQNPFVSYGIGWLGGVLTALLFLFALIKKRVIPAFFSLAVALGIYLSAHQKWIMGTFPLIILMTLISTRNQDGKLKTIRVLRAFSLLVFFFHVMKIFFQFQILIDLPIRRTILDPAIMLQYYIQFAQEYDFQFWSDSNIAKLFTSESEYTVAQIIGERYFNLPYYSFLERPPSMNATAGMLADGIGQAGFLGLMISILVMFVFFWVLTLLSKGRSFTLVFAISSLSFALLMEGGLHTGLLSRGLILVPLLMLVLPRQQSES